jgi:hypothetical protein
MLDQFMNYQNSCLCDVATPFSLPAITGDFMLRVTLIVGVVAAIIVAEILIKRSAKKNSVIQEQHEKQQDPKI